MRQILWAVLGLNLLSLCAVASEVLINDTGDTAVALRVAFSEPVTILGFGDTFTRVEPTSMSRTFEFSGASLEMTGIHWISWSPGTATLAEFEWITEPAKPIMPLEPGAVENVFVIEPPYNDRGFVVTLADPAADTTGPVLPWCDILEAKLLLTFNGQLELEMELASGVPHRPGTDRYAMFHWSIERAIDPQVAPRDYSQVLDYVVIHGDPGSWTASGWWGWRYTYDPFSSEPLEFMGQQEFGRIVKATTPNPGLREGDTIRLIAWVEYQLRGSRVRVDQVPDEGT